MNDESQNATNDEPSPELFDIIPVELSPSGVLGLAIRSELDAYRFYQSALKQVQEPVLRDLLSQLAASERHHFESLRGHFKRHEPAAYAEAVRRIHQGTVGYISVDKRLFELARMGNIELISIALWEEFKAVQLYETALRDSLEPELRVLLQSLVAMEVDHQQQLVAYRERLIAAAT